MSIKNDNLTLLTPPAPRRTWVAAVILFVCCATAVAADMPAQALIDADEELAAFMSEAEALIKNKEYTRGIEILQALIRRPGGGFVASKDGRQFTALWKRGSEIIGSLDAEGMRRYQALYEPQANRLFEQAVSTSDHAALRRISEQYAHTPSGAKALEALAAYHFDRAQFGRAARYWQRLLQSQVQESSRAMLLTKIAVAYHLDGQQRKAAEGLKALAGRHGQTEGVVGGRKQNLLAFAKRAMLLPRPKRIVIESEDYWPGLGGVPDGMATMSDCDVVLTPHWQFPAGVGRSSKLETKNLIAWRSRFSPESVHPQLRSYRRNMATQVRLRDGHVRLTYSYGSRSHETSVPSVIQPVVSGRLVIFRTDQAVVACDIVGGGEPVWKADLKMERVGATGANGRAVIFGSYYPGVALDDGGRYALTVGDGMVFALGDYRMGSGNLRRVVRGQPQQAPADTSVLVALSLRDEGAQIWRVPGPQARQDVLREGKFVSPPTYVSGHVYIVSLYLGSHYLSCLDASTGMLEWSTLISQVPALSRRSYVVRMLSFDEQCSPPAVADGRVHVLTNAGAIAAFDADSGQALWAYQYKSAYADPSRAGASFRGSYSYGQPVTAMPRNPLIVTGGNVICLPSDSAKVLAFDADTGKIAWQADRRGQKNLSAVDTQRVLLSEPGLVVMDLDGGRVLASPPDCRNVSGRPAVSSRSALASGPGKIYRLDFKGYHVTTLPLAESGGLLGNLVSAPNRLLAANTAGVCAYLDYEYVHKEISRRLANATSRDKLDMYMRRLRLSFNARRFAAAMEDIEAARKLAAEVGDQFAGDKLSRWAYRAAVAMANTAADDQEMLRWFLEARKIAAATPDKEDDAHMLIRLAKCRDRIGDIPEAIALAQRIAEDHADQPLVDVEIGSEADVLSRLGPQRTRRNGRDIGQKMIRAMIEIHGQDVYAAFDAQAAAALDKAKTAQDAPAMAAVAERWPHSQWSDDAMLAAAQRWYVQASDDQNARAAGDSAEAVRQLMMLGLRDDSPLRVTANVVMAVLHSRAGRSAVAGIYAQRVRSAPSETRISFADIQGTLGDILERVKAGKTGAGPAVTVMRRLALPLQSVWTIADPLALILRDQQNRPVRLGEYVFLLRKDELSMVEMSASTEAKAMRWKTKCLVDTSRITNFSYPSSAFRLVGGLSADHRVLAVGGRAGVTGVDVGSGKVLWQKATSAYGISNLWCMSAQRGVLVLADRQGALVCVDIATGKTKWTTKLAGGNNSFINPPQITERVVLVRHQQGRNLACMDLATGRIIGRWQGQAVSGMVTSDGLVSVLVDSTLSVYDTHAMAEPAWQTKLTGTKRPVILAATAGHLFLAPVQQQPTVWVLSLSQEGKKVAMLTPAKAGQYTPLPSMLQVDNGRIYVQYSLIYTGTGMNMIARASYARGLSVQCFDLKGKRLWANHIDGDGRNYYSCLPIVFAADHAILTMRQVNYTRASSVRILTRADGKQHAALDMTAKKIDPKVLMRRMFMLGQPATTDGRLLMENGQGVVLYGK